MQPADLRPLSLGELLDRTFTLYRSNFKLFFGISGIPYLAVLALNLGRILFAPGMTLGQLPGHHGTAARPGLNDIAIFGLLGIVVFIVTVVVSVISQGATVSAVSEIYLGRGITIAESLQRSLSAFFRLLGVAVVSGVVIGVAFIFLIIPGIYVACRLLVCIPVTLIEGLLPRQTLERSFALTKDNAGRAFLIGLLYFFLVIVGSALFYFPFVLLVMVSQHTPEIAVFWLALATVGQVFSTVLVSPVLHISSSLFYFDLRVRKEGFDLQLMMSETGSGFAPLPVNQPNLFS